MKRKQLNTKFCKLDSLQEDIKSLKEQYKDYDTQIEIIESDSFENCYFVTIWKR